MKAESYQTPHSGQLGREFFLTGKIPPASRMGLNSRSGTVDIIRNLTRTVTVEGEIMRANRRLLSLSAALAGLALSGATGCQTYFGGMTLPSPRYLDHYPQYFTPDPQYPLQKELNSQMDPEGIANRVGGANPAALPAVGPIGNPVPVDQGR
ncbi:MAG TPA: hypothetical protein VGJ05_18035 [Fimbriiglobus sp.]|jgi:hypothetical protein